MSFNGYLTNQEIGELTEAALNGGLLDVPRQLLLDGIPSGFAATMARTDSPLNQFRLDLVNVSKVERMAGGEVPVLTLLQNAAAQLRLLGRTEAGVFERALSRIGNVAVGMLPLPDPAQLPEITRNERIIGIDDSVDIGFLAAGLEIAQAVALISVPRYERGRQVMAGSVSWVSSGTAWLIAPSLVITNYHVINARRTGEAPAELPDLELQAAGATLRFDYDSPKADGLKVKTARLVAYSKALDYALLEVDPLTGRPIPRIAPSAIEVDPTLRMAVNIVQHPRGEHKRVAFRNNLVSGADATTIRYFTDTDGGSSGSPVCDDQWRVVALHRGALRVTGVQFQGKGEAYVNFGSQIHAILADIRAFPDAAAAMAAGRDGGTNASIDHR
jgi:endonuclease G, mitochondrial